MRNLPYRILMVANDNHVVDRRIIQQARTLADCGHKVDVICGFEVDEDRIESHDGIVVHRFAMPADRGAGGSTFIGRFIDKVEKVVRRLSGRNTVFEQQVIHQVAKFDFDVLHIHDMPLLRVGSQIADASGVRFVYDAHELYFAQASVPRLARIRMRREESKYISRPDLVFTVNDFVADEMIRIYRRKDIKVLLNSAPTLLPKSTTSPTLRELAGVAVDAKVVLYQGWISAERGLEHLIASASHWRGRVYLTVVGYGDFVETLRSQVEASGLGESVKFLGRMSYDELRRLTPQADVGVIPYLPCDFNTKFCSPNKFFEYVAAGVPVVSNDLPFLRQQIEKYKCGRIANVKDGENFASAVLELLEDRSAGKACKDAQFELGWEVEKLKLVGWYDALQ